MGFQGDVAGIGLGELLQGLARGGREGVLTLHGQSQTATLGVQQGQIFLLPEPNEDPDIWRQRVRRAWVRDPNERIDTIRMSDVAFAARLEQAFVMLDSEGVHFRFEPGPLPTGTPPPEIVGLDGEEQPRRAHPVHCPGIAVEYLLLEHARLSDESQGHGPRLRLSLHDVPRIFDASRVVQANQRFCSECDGMSNIVEIADRLAWPLRQCRAWAEEMIAQGVLRLSDARELLVQAQHELGVEQFARAASRLAGWVLRAPPGPPPAGDVQLLSTAWVDGRLQTVLGFMEPRLARRLLRRMELVEREPRMAYERWRELRKHHRHDRLAEVRMLGWQLRSDNDTIAPALTDLLKLARNFQDEGRLRRAGVMLRAAAARLPETTSMRLELGNRLMAVGLVADGAPWVLEACRTLIQSGHAEKALAPLRAVMTYDGANREARTLLMQARARSARGRRRRRILVIASSVLLVLSLLGLVQLRMERKLDRKLAEVERMADQPRQALARLNDLFPDSQSAGVADLRATLVTRIQKEEGVERDAWMERYREAELECTLGDPILGLRRVFDLAQPPRTEYLEFEWPQRAALMHALASKLEQEVAEWDASPEDPPSELAAEERLLETLTGLQHQVEQNRGDPEVDGFAVRLETLHASVIGRREKREAERATNARNALQQEQDLLLAAARAHEKAGDLERAVMAFRKLLATPESDVLRRALGDEIERVEQHYNALVEARRLAQKGEHRRGLEVLREHCPNPTEHQLPSQIESEPSGALARFADGTTRTTPFTLESAPGEDLVFVLELAGHEDHRIEMHEPGDRFALMSRLPSLWWRTAASVDAVPTFVGGDYILGDRDGRLVRLNGDSRPVWEKRLDSLGGMARAPVFLRALPSHMLAVTEDGQAWLVEAQSGDLEGPWSLASPPWQGPLVEGQLVVVRCADGSIARWSARLKPEVEEVDPQQPRRVEGEAFGPSAGLEVLRRRTGTELTLRSPWSRWQVTVEEQSFVVQDTQESQPAFRIRLQEPWSYVAWEAPSKELPNGRLWISDGTGLRGFEPE
jgi:tetratricopeptide (TPR) repeat protein